MSEESFSKRIKAIANLVGGVEELAQRTGLSTRSIYDYLNGTTKPRSKNLISIANAAGVSIHWLATGEGEMRAGLSVGETKPNYDDEFVMIPPYGEGTGTEGGAERIDVKTKDRLAFKRSWLKQQGLRPDKLALLTVRGDSMEPTLHQSDTVLIDISQIEIKDDAIYALRVDEQVILKRVQRLIDGGLCIRSDNPAYQQQCIAKEELPLLHIVGRVVWFGRMIY